ncbi:MAG TPA: hypothetical protein PLQ20_03145 [Candidatus Paceibacterota bacterium]|nr:hypothetical protein [Candidatus Paceibacterota bacterium]
MVLSDEDITKFQKLYKEHFGVEISKEDAYEKGVKLLRLMSIVYKPMTEKDYDLIQKHRYDTLHLLQDKLNEKSS